MAVVRAEDFQALPFGFVLGFQERNAIDCEGIVSRGLIPHGPGFEHVE